MGVIEKGRDRGVDEERQIPVYYLELTGAA
jgi:hypothetical protein